MASATKVMRGLDPKTIGTGPTMMTPPHSVLGLTGFSSVGVVACPEGVLRAMSTKTRTTPAMTNRIASAPRAVPPYKYGITKKMSPTWISPERTPATIPTAPATKSNRAMSLSLDILDQLYRAADASASVDVLCLDVSFRLPLAWTILINDRAVMGFMLNSPLLWAANMALMS